MPQFETEEEAFARMAAIENENSGLALPKSSAWSDGLAKTDGLARAKRNAEKAKERGDFRAQLLAVLDESDKRAIAVAYLAAMEDDLDTLEAFGYEVAVARGEDMMACVFCKRKVPFEYMAGVVNIADGAMAGESGPVCCKCVNRANVEVEAEVK